MFGLGLGLTTAVISVLPQGGELIAQLPRIALLIAVVLVVGILVVIMATRSALRTPILTALRQE